jgi:hypothetical protein
LPIGAWAKFFARAITPNIPIFKDLYLALPSDDFAIVAELVRLVVGGGRIAVRNTYLYVKERVELYPPSTLGENEEKYKKEI